MTPAYSGLCIIYPSQGPSRPGFREAVMRRRVLCIPFLCGLVWAQNELASLTGTITDSSGAAAVRASVRLANADTGESQQVATSDSGSYDFQLLKPGRYTLTVELPGFKQFVQNGI